LLSVIIITKNEAKNVAICLDSLVGIADEIIVIDSFSTDETREISLKYGALFFQREWNGYSEAKNFGNDKAQYDCILSIDADEALSPELRKSILEVKSAKAPELVEGVEPNPAGPSTSSGTLMVGEPVAPVPEPVEGFYTFNRLTNYCGQWIRHGGWYPDTKLRLFDRRIARWQGDFAHETLVFPNTIKPIKLKGDLFHYSFNSIEQHVDKVNKYSSLIAAERLSHGRTGSAFKMIFGPIATFFKFYIIKTGFLDGRNGFIIAVISAYDNFLRSAKQLGN